MIRQCAWCSRVVGQAAPLEDPSVTHGVCPECYAKCVGSLEERRRPTDDAPAVLSTDAIS